MKRLYTIMMLSIFSSFSFAQLSNLNAEQLSEVRGQANETVVGGADLSLTLSLNHHYANDLSKLNISETSGQDSRGIAQVTTAYYVMRPTLDCPMLELCRLAISPNNHIENDQKKWLVFKGIQGTIQIDQFTLSGTTFINQEGIPQSAMRLTFYDGKPLKIRNLGFTSLSVESGNEGYFNTSIYSKVGATDRNVPAFDNGQETGFMGLNIHGNLHADGHIKIFNINCSGSNTSRC